MPGENDNVAAVAQPCQQQHGLVAVVRNTTGNAGLGNFVVRSVALGNVTTDGHGVADYGQVDPAVYPLTVAAPNGAQAYWTALSSVQASTTAGDALVTLTATPVVDTVTPSIVAAASEVWFDPIDHQDTPVKLTLSLSHSAAGIAFPAGGHVTVSSNEGTLYTDAQCKTKLVGDTVANGAIAGGSHELYLKGATAGKVTVTFTLDDPGSPHITIGQAATVEVTIIDKVVVTAKIETEYDVAVLDRGLASHAPVKQQASLQPVPTAVKLSMSASRNDPAFPGGAKLSQSADRFDVFADVKRKQPIDLSQTIAANDLANAGKTVYLRGKAAGKLDVKLTPEDPADPRFKVVVATREMATVNLQMQVHREDSNSIAALTCNPNTNPIATYHTNLNNLVLPAQVVLDDTRRVTKGRLLHVQSGGHHGRARLLLPQLSAVDWPNGCGNYELVVGDKSKSGTLKLFDAAAGGNEVAMPARYKVSDLINARVELWVEGHAESEAIRESQLMLALHRPQGGMDRVYKKYADLCNFTVVKIQGVELVVPPHDSKAPSPWDPNTNRWFINLQKGKAGRKIELRARLTRPIRGVKIHFMLAPDVNNRQAANWGVAMPGTWNWSTISWKLKRKDKARPQDLLHLGKSTDDKGVATQEVMLSKIGGDKFQAGAYIGQDPHLAKYTPGHLQLSTRAPTVGTTINVWRKVWYQLTHARSSAIPSPASAVQQYAAVKVQLEPIAPMKFTEKDMPKGTFYPRYMIDDGSTSHSTAIVLGDHNSKKFKKMIKADTRWPLLTHLMCCDYQFDKGGATNVQAPITSSPSGWIQCGDTIIDPPIQGGSVLIKGEWLDPTPPNNGRRSGKIRPRDLIFPPGRTDLERIKLRLPPAHEGGPSRKPTALQPITVKLSLRHSNGPYLGESKANQIMVVVQPGSNQDFNNTIVHEIGHAFNQTSKPGKQPATIPARGSWNQGMGVHCTHLTGGRHCVMFEDDTLPWLNRWCDVCHPYLLVEDFSRYKSSS